MHGRDPREYLVATKSFKPSATDPNQVGSVMATKVGLTAYEWGHGTDSFLESAWGGRS